MVSLVFVFDMLQLNYMKRCFVAINLPNNIKDEFELIQADLGQRNKQLVASWVDKEIAHINLHFLGDLTESEVQIVRNALKAVVGKFGQISLSLTGIGAFPSKNNPRVLFLGVREKDGTKMVNLQRELGVILKKESFDVNERPFIAHVTICRIKNFVAGKLDFVGEEMADTEFQIDSFELMESLLTPAGPEYKMIESYRI